MQPALVVVILAVLAPLLHAGTLCATFEASSASVADLSVSA